MLKRNSDYFKRVNYIFLVRKHIYDRSFTSYLLLKGKDNAGKSNTEFFFTKSLHFSAEGEERRENIIKGI